MKCPQCVIVAAIMAIAGVEIYALSRGINGVILTLSLTAIAGLAGWVSPQLKLKK